MKKQEVPRITNKDNFWSNQNNKKRINEQKSSTQPESTVKQATNQGSSSNYGFRFWFYKCSKQGYNFTKCCKLNNHPRKNVIIEKPRKELVQDNSNSWRGFV